MTVNNFSFDYDVFLQEVVTGLRIPERLFPKPFFVHDQRMVCGGFFDSFNQYLTVDKIVENCQRQNWKNLVSMADDLFVVYADLSNLSVKILTGISGKFPCYFCIENNQVVISPSFKLVHQSLKHPDVNTAVALEFLDFGYLILTPDETLIKQIHQLPPATLMTLGSELKFSLAPVFSRDELLQESAEPDFESIEAFSQAIIETGLEVMKGYYRELKEIPIAAELSSGFDSSLVCYLASRIFSEPPTCHSWISPLMTEDTKPEVVSDFCRKHRLKQEIIDVTPFYPFCSDEGIGWSGEQFYPADHAQEKALFCYRKISQDGIKAIFTGHGGDELYGSAGMGQYVRFPVQRAYFQAVDSLKWNLGSILTTKGIDLLLDRSRFGVKNYYPSPLAPSTLAVGQLYYPIYWESDLWPLMPLSDQRLIEIAKRIPKSLQKGEQRQNIWRHRLDIFVRGQFTKKGGPERLIDRYITEKRDLLISILNRSILGQVGLVKNNDLVNSLRRGQDKFFLQPGVSLYLHNLVRLEIFLQHS